MSALVALIVFPVVAMLLGPTLEHSLGRIGVWLARSSEEWFPRAAAGNRWWSVIDDMWTEACEGKRPKLTVFAEGIRVAFVAVPRRCIRLRFDGPNPVGLVVAATAVWLIVTVGMFATDQVASIRYLADSGQMQQTVQLQLKLDKDTGSLLSLPYGKTRIEGAAVLAMSVKLGLEKLPISGRLLSDPTELAGALPSLTNELLGANSSQLRHDSQALSMAVGNRRAEASLRAQVALDHRTRQLLLDAGTYREEMQAEAEALAATVSAGLQTLPIPAKLRGNALGLARALPTITPQLEKANAAENQRDSRLLAAEKALVGSDLSILLMNASTLIVGLFLLIAGATRSRRRSRAMLRWIATASLTVSAVSACLWGAGPGSLSELTLGLMVAGFFTLIPVVERMRSTTDRITEALGNTVA